MSRPISELSPPRRQPSQVRGIGSTIELERGSQCPVVRRAVPISPINLTMPDAIITVPSSRCTSPGAEWASTP